MAMSAARRCSTRPIRAISGSMRGAIVIVDVGAPPPPARFRARRTPDVSPSNFRPDSIGSSSIAARRRPTRARRARRRAPAPPIRRWSSTIIRAAGSRSTALADRRGHGPGGADARSRSRGGATPARRASRRDTTAMRAATASHIAAFCALADDGAACMARTIRSGRQGGAPSAKSVRRALPSSPSVRAEARRRRTRSSPDASVGRRLAVRSGRPRRSISRRASSSRRPADARPTAQIVLRGRAPRRMLSAGPSAGGVTPRPRRRRLAETRAVLLSPRAP